MAATTEAMILAFAVLISTKPSPAATIFSASLSPTRTLLPLPRAIVPPPCLMISSYNAKLLDGGGGGSDGLYGMIADQSSDHLVCFSMGGYV